LAHRISYELCVGPIPEGMTVDHTCRNHCCVNPEHLELVTSKENTRRARELKVGDHCSHGHLIASESDLSKRGECNRCKLDAQKRWRERRGREVND
jgi:hypothetical protein